MKKKILAAFLLLLVTALIVDFGQETELQNGVIYRDVIGGEEKKIPLFLDIDGVCEKEPYTLEVLPIQPTKDEAEGYFKKAIATIESDFQEIKEKVPMQTEYENGAVEADWYFEPYGLIDSEGNIRQEKLEDQNTIVNAQVTLSCGSYEKIYSFAFSVIPQEMSTEEVSRQLLESWINQQMSLEGSKSVQLPTQINGKKVTWSEKREYSTPQILLLELTAIVLLWFISKQKRIQEEQARIQKMEQEYPEIVNQLSLLLGAGMTTRQAWNKLTAQYRFKRENKMIEEKEVYEAIVRMNRRFCEGESERAVYQQFSQEIPAICFHKLMRILLGNLEKGTQGICSRLEEEGRVAYEQRIQQAKKMGEEASTKMLLPLMLMMVIVMGIVMLPALIEFQI